MQYIFGDNRSSYAIIHTDTTEQEAKKLNSLIRFAITPNENFNILGYLTYGTNSSNAMFFQIKKDKSIPRSCYFTHAFNRELGHEYYSKKIFECDMFANFVEQEEYDALRDGEKKDCEITFNQDLLARAQTASVIDRAVLLEVVASLYQKKKVLLAIDDDKYSDDLVRVVIKQIFDCLTPSLKKAVSYLSAVVDTGNADVMLRIVPKSMMADVREAYLDIDGTNTPAPDNNIFYRIAECLIGEEGNARRIGLFKNYEILFHGKDSVYKKQNMEELFLTYDGTDRARLEKIVDNYLAQSNVTSMNEVTNHVKNNLVPIFTQEAELEKRFEFKEEDILDPCALFEANEIFIYKALLYSDIIDKFLCDRIARACYEFVLTKNNCRAVAEAIQTVRTKKASDELNVPEKYFYIKILTPIYEKVLLPRHKTCVDLLNKTGELIRSKITSREDPIEPSEKKFLKESLSADCAALVAACSENTKNIELTDHIEESIEDEMFRLNKDFKEGKIGGECKFPNEEVIQYLYDIDKALCDGVRFAEIKDTAKMSLDFQGKYIFMVDDLLCMYIINEYKAGRHADVKTFIQEGRLDDDESLHYYTDKLAKLDPSLSLCFVLDNYPSFDKAIRKVISTVVKEAEEIGKMSAAEVELYSTNICKALERFVGTSNEKKDSVIKKLEGAMKDVDKKGNSYKILDSMKYMCKNGKMKKNIIADSTLLNIIIGSIGGVAVIFMILSILFMTGVFGGASKQENNADNDDNGVSTGEAADSEDGTPADSDDTSTANSDDSQSSSDTDDGAATSEPGAETETPSTETPSTETPSTETPSTDTPSTDTPSTDTPSTDTPSTDTPSTDTPSID